MKILSLLRLGFGKKAPLENEVAFPQERGGIFRTLILRIDHDERVARDLRDGRKDEADAGGHYLFSDDKLDGREIELRISAVQAMDQIEDVSIEWLPTSI